MSLENVKVGDWIKVQVTDINENSQYPIKIGNDEISLTRKGEFVEGYRPIAFPLETTERWMIVSDDEIEWYKRKVIMEKNGKFIAWDCAETEEKVAEKTGTSAWDYAKEIEQPIELTLEEIAEKFGISVEQLKIKK